jgi:hypothetical protein
LWTHTFLDCGSVIFSFCIVLAFTKVETCWSWGKTLKCQLTESWVESLVMYVEPYASAWFKPTASF